MTRFAGRIAASERPSVRDPLIRRFVRAYDVDMAEAERPLGQYKSFNDFFTRALKPGARPLADAETCVLCPADGAVSQLGRIADGRILQAKGHDYTVAQLLGGDEALAKRFHNGNFITVYLSPKDYHRVHMPTGGTLESTTYVPGDLFSVNQATAAGVPGLFARNERLSCIFDTSHGSMASVMVGAMIVAGIETVWGGRVAPHGKRLERDTPGTPHQTGCGRGNGPVPAGIDSHPAVRTGPYRMDGGIESGRQRADGAGHRSLHCRLIRGANARNGRASSPDSGHCADCRAADAAHAR